MWLAPSQPATPSLVLGDSSIFQVRSITYAHMEEYHLSCDTVYAPTDMLRVLRVRWLSAAWKKTLDSRRPGRGISPVAVDEAVVGATTARCTTAPMKQEDAMKGSWSGAVDERHQSLVVDDEVGIAAPARWRMGWRTEEASHGGEVVVAPMVYE